MLLTHPSFAQRPAHRFGALALQCPLLGLEAARAQRIIVLCAERAGIFLMPCLDRMKRAQRRPAMSRQIIEKTRDACHLILQSIHSLRRVALYGVVLEPIPIYIRSHRHPRSLGLVQYDPK